MPSLFSVSSFVHCFEFNSECYTRKKQVQHVTRMLHYGASRHFFVVSSTFFLFQGGNFMMSEQKKARQLVKLWTG